LDDRVAVDWHSTDWLTVRDLPGILPTQQRRSQETTVALLEAAAAMLRERSLDELSIEDLCTRVGVTIGAFYGRFESKDAFFSALMSLAARKALAAVRVAVADQDNPATGLEEACRRVVEVAVDVVRRNVGVVRAAAQYESIYPERWGTIRATGSGMVDLATPLLLARMGRGRIPAKTRSIGFAFQMQCGPAQAETCLARRTGNGRPSCADDVPSVAARSARGTAGEIAASLILRSALLRASRRMGHIGASWFEMPRTMRGSSP
jgi:AcrR family transcriptional regulator